MTVYCFVCPGCGYRVETPVRDPAPTCGRHSLHYESLRDAVVMRREWRAEAAVIRMAREDG